MYVCVCECVCVCESVCEREREATYTQHISQETWIAPHFLNKTGVGGGIYKPDIKRKKNATKEHKKHKQVYREKIELTQ